MLENIKIVGTSHISSQSLERIKETFFDFKPTIIAIELDRDRLFALEHPESQKKGVPFNSLFKIGLTGFLFSIIGRWAQKKLGSIVNLNPGSDMLFASTLAKKNNLKLFLIDRPIGITLKRFSKAFTFKEKFNVLKDFFMSLFSKKHRLQFDLSKIPKEDLIQTLLEKTKKTYPSLHKTLIEERNHYMTKKTIHIMKKFPNEKIMVVVGAGHKKEMENLLPYYEHKIENINS